MGISEEWIREEPTDPEENKGDDTLFEEVPDWREVEQHETDSILDQEEEREDERIKNGE